MNYDSLLDKFEHIKEELVSVGFSMYSCDIDQICGLQRWKFRHADGRKRVLYLCSHYRAYLLLTDDDKILIHLKADY